MVRILFFYYVLLLTKCLTEAGFAKYLQMVTSRGYFDGVAKDTPEYEERLKKVRQRFELHEQKKQQSQPTPVASTATPTPAATPATDKYTHLTLDERKVAADAKKDAGTLSYLYKSSFHKGLTLLLQN